MTRLAPSHPLTRVLKGYLTESHAAEFLSEPLRASRPVFRFSQPEGQEALVGKFFLGSSAEVPGGESGERSISALPPQPPQSIGSTGILPVPHGLEAHATGFWRGGRGLWPVAPSPTKNF